MESLREGAEQTNGMRGRRGPVIPRGHRAKLALGGLLKLVGLVVAAGTIGAALGVGLLKLSQDAEPSTPLGGTDPPAQTAATGGGENRPSTTSSAATTNPAPADVPPAVTTTIQSSDPRSPVRVSVLDARLFTDVRPSGRQEQRARMVVRVRAENAGSRRETLEPPSLRVGSVSIEADSGADAPGTGLATLGAGARQTVTLRFSLAGEATPKVVRDRRARIFIAARLIALRVKVQAPRTT